MKRGDQDQESEGLFPLAGADIREQAAALAAAAWLMAGVELDEDPEKPPTEEPKAVPG